MEYGVKIHGTYSERSRYEYYYNEQCLIAYDVASQSTAYLFPLLPDKGDNLIEQLFLDSFISLVYSECNNFNRHFTRHPIKSLQDTLIKCINSLELDKYKKLVYKSLIYTNIVNVTRSETRRKTIIYNIRAGIVNLFFSGPSALIAIFIFYKAPSFLIPFFNHFGLLGTIISYTISPIIFFSTALIILLYIAPRKRQGCGGADIGHTRTIILPAKINITTK
jgi:hypothetical protein